MWGQDGWILAKFFFACLWTETKSRSINSQKKRTRPISNHLDRTNLVNKGFIICLSGKFFMRDTAGSPERARWLHLARSGSQSQRAIWFILPARGASQIIKGQLLEFNQYNLFIVGSTYQGSTWKFWASLYTQKQWQLMLVVPGGSTTIPQIDGNGCWLLQNWRNEPTNPSKYTQNIAITKNKQTKFRILNIIISFLFYYMYMAGKLLHCDWVRSSLFMQNNARKFLIFSVISQAAQT